MFLDTSGPNATVIQAFSNLRYLDFFLLPESVRIKMTEELKKWNKKLTIDDQEDTFVPVKRKGGRIKVLFLFINLFNFSLKK